MAPDPGLARLLDCMQPSELALRDWVSPQLDAAMLDEIAAADYGFNAAENREAVKELRYVSRLPQDMSEYPEEVLELTRWSTVDAAMSPAQARRLHLKRMFCCLVLVRATTANDYPVNSLTPLVESAVELGPEAVEAAGRYLAWCRLEEPGDWRDDLRALPILTLGLVTVSAMLPAGRDPNLLPGLLSMFADELCAAVDEENLAWSTRPIHDLLKRLALSESRRPWVDLASRCLLDGPAQSTGSGPQLSVLGQAIRRELAVDAAELRVLLQQPPIQRQAA